MTHVPREGGIADRTIKLLMSIDGRPIKQVEAAEQIDAPASSMSASLNTVVASGLIVREMRAAGTYLFMPGCGELDPWTPTGTYGVQRVGNHHYTVPTFIPQQPDPMYPPALPVGEGAPAIRQWGELKGNSPTVVVEVAAQSPAPESKIYDVIAAALAPAAGAPISNVLSLHARTEESREIIAELAPTPAVEPMRCAYWHDAAFELRKGGVKICLTPQETDAMVAYLALFKGKPGQADKVEGA